MRKRTTVDGSLRLAVACLTLVFVYGVVSMISNMSKIQAQWELVETVSLQHTDSATAAELLQANVAFRKVEVNTYLIRRHGSRFLTVLQESNGDKRYSETKHPVAISNGMRPFFAQNKRSLRGTGQYAEQQESLTPEESLDWNPEPEEVPSLGDPVTETIVPLLLVAVSSGIVVCAIVLCLTDLRDRRGYEHYIGKEDHRKDEVQVGISKKRTDTSTSFGSREGPWRPHPILPPLRADDDDDDDGSTELALFHARIDLAVPSRVSTMTNTFVEAGDLDDDIVKDLASGENKSSTERVIELSEEHRIGEDDDFGTLVQSQLELGNDPVSDNAPETPLCRIETALSCGDLFLHDDDEDDDEADEDVLKHHRVDANMKLEDVVSSHQASDSERLEVCTEKTEESPRSELVHGGDEGRTQSLTPLPLPGPSTVDVAVVSSSQPQSSEAEPDKSTLVSYDEETNEISCKNLSLEVDGDDQHPSPPRPSPTLSTANPMVDDVDLKVLKRQQAKCDDTPQHEKETEKFSFANPSDHRDQELPSQANHPLPGEHCTTEDAVGRVTTTSHVTGVEPDHIEEAVVGATTTGHLTECFDAASELSEPRVEPGHTTDEGLCGELFIDDSEDDDEAQNTNPIPRILLGASSFDLSSRERGVDREEWGKNHALRLAMGEDEQLEHLIDGVATDFSVSVSTGEDSDSMECIRQIVFGPVSSITPDVLGLGFGDALLPNSHPSVVRVSEASPMKGRIFEGDFLLRVNTVRTLGMSAGHVERLLVAGHGFSLQVVTLTVMSYHKDDDSEGDSLASSVDLDKVGSTVEV